MTRGERQQIPSTDALLAAVRVQAVQTKAAPRITIPLPSACQVKTVAWWTLGIVLFICALPFVLWGQTRGYVNGNRRTFWGSRARRLARHPGS